MNPSVQQLLASFDALPDADKHYAVVEILRRCPSVPEGETVELMLVEVADELFRALDEEEASNASR